MIALFFFTWMYIISTTNWELSDYMCELIYLKTWFLCYKNCRVALFLTFLLFPYLILKLLTIVQKVKMSYISFFFQRFEHFYISLDRTPVQCVSEYTIPFTLYIYDLYSLQKWPRSSKPFSWKWNWSYCYVPRRDTNVR